MPVSRLAQSIRGLLLRFVMIWIGRALCIRERFNASIMSGFFPSAEIKNTGLADARVGLQMSSSGVDGRDTRPVYASCRLQRSEATVNDPPDPTPITLNSLAPEIAVFIRWISVSSDRVYVVSIRPNSVSYFVRDMSSPDKVTVCAVLINLYSPVFSRSLCDLWRRFSVTQTAVPLGGLRAYCAPCRSLHPKFG